MVLSQNTFKRIQIGLTALLTIASSFGLHAQENQKSSLVKQACTNPSADNLFLEWRAGPTNFNFIAESTLTIYNNHPSASFSGGEVVNGTFQPCWKLYFNQPFTAATGETRFVVEASDPTLNYFVLTPTETFGSIPPGGSLTLNLEAGFENAVVFGLLKICKNGSPSGVHIAYTGEDQAHFVPLKSIVDVNDPAVMSRLPLALAGLGIVDAVPVDNPMTRYPKGVADQTVSLQKRIVPNPTYLATNEGAFDIRSIKSVKAENGLNFEKNYLIFVGFEN